MALESIIPAKANFLPLLMSLLYMLTKVTSLMLCILLDFLKTVDKVTSYVPHQHLFPNLAYYIWYLHKVIMLAVTLVMFPWEYFKAQCWNTYFLPGHASNYVLIIHCYIELSIHQMI